MIGGGWVGWLGYDGPHHLAFYDHLLRYDDDSGRWSFEALWTRRRSSALRARREQFRTVLAAVQRDTPHETLPRGQRPAWSARSADPIAAAT